MLILAAYHWIVIDAHCPLCSTDTVVRCQTHTAADFAGDATGRFCHREYRLGDAMAWFPVGHDRRDDWFACGGIPKPGELVDEACYAECTRCHGEICVVIQFRDLVPVVVARVSRVDDWPEGHPL